MVTITLSTEQVELLTDSLKSSVNHVEEIIKTKHELIKDCHERIACNEYDDIDKLVDTIDQSAESLEVLHEVRDQYTKILDDVQTSINNE